MYADVPGGSSPVCRFFSTAFGAKSSHFYTPDANECTTVKANPNWQFEAEVFALPRPNAVGHLRRRRCPVYRLYNNGQGAAPNHRYTTSLATRTTMLDQGLDYGRQRQLRRYHVQPDVRIVAFRNFFTTTVAL